MIFIGSGYGVKNGFNAKERNALIRYAVSIGMRAKLTTRFLMRPLKMKDLRAAFAENEQKFIAENEKYKRLIEEYDPQTTELSSGFIDYFGGVPTKEQYAEYYNALICQNKDTAKSIRNGYIINVDTSAPKKLLRLHRSLNPRVTFGYSNMLHEECDFALTEQNKQLLLSSSLTELPMYEQDEMHDYGHVIIGESSCDGLPLYYEDLCVYVGDKCVLDCTSHEQACSVDFTDDELKGFIVFENKKKLNEKILKKLEQNKQA